MNLLERTMAFLVGDGSVFYSHLDKDSNPVGNCVFDFHHGPNQEGYMMWKFSEMKNLGFDGNFIKRPVVYKAKGSQAKYEGRVYVSCQVRMKADRIFTELRKIAYPGNVKTYHSGWVNESVIDDYALAVWWMDDGGVHVTGKNKNHVSGYLFCCCDNEEARMIKCFLEEKLDHEVSVQRKRDKFNLYLSNKAYVALLKRCLPYLHSSMLYKCAVTTGEDGKPIIPTSAEQLRGMLNEK